jgi:hypothetical protein
MTHQHALRLFPCLPFPTPQFQCEQTNENKGCTTVGVCGKTPTVAGLQVSVRLFKPVPGTGFRCSAAACLAPVTPLFCSVLDVRTC